MNSNKLVCSAQKLVILIVLFFPIVFAGAQEQKDVSAELIIPSIVNASNYTKFARLTNNDDVPGLNDNLSLLVQINLSHPETILFWNVSKTINSYSESGMGILEIENGTYYICIYAEPLNFIDYNLQNNLVCRNISTSQESEYLEYNLSDFNESVNASINESEVNISDFNISSGNISDNLSDNLSDYVLDNLSDNISEGNMSNINASEINCTCAPSIFVEKQLFSEGEKIRFQLDDCGQSSKLIFPVEYWIEDRKGIVKQIINTTAKSEKTYTPTKISGEKYFLIKARTQGCQNTSEMLVVFAGEEESFEKETSLEIIVPKEEDSEIMYVEIKGSKADTDKTLISLWLESEGKKYSEITKAYVLDKNSDFSFKLPLILNVEETNDFTVIAEGLGEREEAHVKILRAKSNENEAAVQEENAQSIVEKDSPKIKSFYTLKKNYDDNITVYISIEKLSNESAKNTILKIKTSNDEKIIEDIKEKNAVNISIQHSDETIAAELFEVAQIDRRELALNLSEEQEKIEKQESTDVYEENVSIGLQSNQNKENLSLDQKTEKISENKITARVIKTDFSNASMLFVCVAIIISFIIFNKKARNYINKKTNIFKRDVLTQGYEEQRNKGKTK
ncbi:MAG: hypothetical protein ACP5N3_00640 [Candidatus Nanoarchaeia archaeon]